MCIRDRREIAEGVVWTDPHQKNLFDVYEPEDRATKNITDNEQSSEDFPAVDYTNLEVGDDPLLAIVAEHIMHVLESLGSKGLISIHFNALLQQLTGIGIREEEVDEAITWLLQREMIIELEQDYFSLDI